MSEETGMAFGTDKATNLEDMVNRVQSLHNYIYQEHRKLEGINDGLFGALPQASEPDVELSPGDHVFSRLDQSIRAAENNFELLSAQIARLKDCL